MRVVIKVLPYFLGLLFAGLCFGHPGHFWDPDGPLEISIEHPAFHEKEGMLYLGSEVFTGYVVQEDRETELTEDEYPQLLLRVSYKDGLRSGPSYEWYKNGMLKSTFYYAKGELSGLQHEWWENGRPKSKREYVMGAICGREWSWSEAGKILKSEFHQLNFDKEE